jgi:hypothetical protein
LKTVITNYLSLISEGKSEKQALDLAGLPLAQYYYLLLNDKNFVVQVEEARKFRSEVWVDKIIETVDHDYSKDEVPSEKLKFEKLQFLAKSDNPEKFNPKKMDINIDIGKFSLIAPEEAAKVLASDPFAPKEIEAEFTEVEDLL